MDIPPYLLLFLLEIRRHENEPGYLKARCEGKPLQEALYERGLFAELLDRHLVFRSAKNDHATYASAAPQQFQTGFTSRGHDTETVYFPRRFLVAPAGKHAIRVAAFRLAFWACAIAAAQIIVMLVEWAAH